MPKINKKRVALVEALGPTARKFTPGECMIYGVMINRDGSRKFVTLSVDAEHDGSFAISQVGGVLTSSDVLAKSNRGETAARTFIKEH